jgi:hypothetical protein
MSPPNEGRPSGEGRPDEPNTSDNEQDNTPTPMFDGMTSGKVRPAPREPDVTHYRDRRFQ